MYTYKIFNNISAEGIDCLEVNGFTKEEKNPDALLIRSKLLNEGDFNKSLKCICRAGAGVNHIPIDMATERGVVVFNTPGGNANAVKELVICGLLLSSRGIIQGHQFAQTLSKQDADELTHLVETNKKNFKGNELKGKTIGIIGLGAIGSLLAQSVVSMDMKVIGYDPNISIDAAWQLPKEVVKADNLKDLLSNSDYISIHVPLVEETKNLISNDVIKFIKPGAKLINLSRGSIVNNKDVLNALENKKISTFVTDFPSPEMVKRSIKFSDVILLPHLGASTKEAEINCAVMAADQLKDFLENGNIHNSVNYPPTKMSRNGGSRITFSNNNVPKVLGSVLSILADSEINVVDMVNKSRGEIAYNIIDVEGDISTQLREKIAQVDGVMRVRLL